MRRLNIDGEEPDLSYMKLIYELYGQPAVDKYMEDFKEEEETLNTKNDSVI